MDSNWNLYNENHKSRSDVHMHLSNNFKNIGTSYINYLVDMLCALYHGKAYHNLNHISDILLHLRAFKSEIDNEEELLMAVLFHDAIYTGCGKDDVIASSHVAKCTAKGMGLSENSIERIGKLILSTYDHHPYNNDSRILCDCDMAVLASADYKDYAVNVKTEYLKMGIPEEDYDSERLKFLNKISSKNIYHTSYGKNTWEKRAHSNVLKEIDWIKNRHVILYPE